MLMAKGPIVFMTHAKVEDILKKEKEKEKGKVVSNLKLPCHYEVVAKPQIQSVDVPEV